MAVVTLVGTFLELLLWREAVEWVDLCSKEEGYDEGGRGRFLLDSEVGGGEIEVAESGE